jgi:hypothetical protein
VLSRAGISGPERALHSLSPQKDSSDRRNTGIWFTPQRYLSSTARSHSGSFAALPAEAICLHGFITVAAVRPVAVVDGPGRAEERNPNPKAARLIPCIPCTVQTTPFIDLVSRSD